MTKHYIVQSGDHGYVPNSSATFESEESALDYANDEIRYGMDCEYDNGMTDNAIDSKIESMQQDLRDYGIADYDLSDYDLSYISIVLCDCDKPCQHNDSGEPCEFCPHCQRESFESTLYWQWRITGESVDRMLSEMLVAHELNVKPNQWLKDSLFNAQCELTYIESQVVSEHSPLARLIKARKGD